MVVLSQFPSMETVRALKGTVDFYVDHGRVIARSWPRKRRGAPRQAEIWQQHWLRQANNAYRALHNNERRVYHYLTKQGSFTPRDMFMKHYFGSFPYPSEFSQPARPPARAYDPKGPSPYFGILASELYYDGVGDAYFRIQTTTEATYNAHAKRGNSLIPHLHKVARRGITFNRCWRQTLNELLIGRNLFPAPAHPYYEFRLGSLQPTSGLQWVTFFIDALHLSPFTHMRGFSHWYYLLLVPAADVAPNTYWPVYHPPVPNLRSPVTLFASLAPFRIDTPVTFVPPLSTPMTLQYPFRDRDP